VSAVARVAVLPAPRRVPLAPPAILGLCNYRGSTLTALDPAALLELPEGTAADADPGAPGPVLVLTGRGGTVGLRIGRAEAVVALAADRFRALTGRGEHPAVAGLLTPAERPGLTVTVLSAGYLDARLDALRPGGRASGASGPAAATSPAPSTAR
jgi:purine-binding chemotaxis protein CheW